MRIVFIFLFFAEYFYASTMSNVVSNMIAKNKIDPSQVSVLIKDLHNGNTLVSHNAGTIRKPASVMKLFTTYSSLLEFGPNFRWPTRVYYRGKYSKGVIHGDLIIKGYGDPTLSSSDVRRMVYKLRRLGIKSIDGNIVLDRTFFGTPDRVSSGFDKNKFSEYNAMPDAIMFNDHMITVIVKSNGNRVNVYKSANDRSYKVVNKIVSTTESCKGSRAWPKVLVNTGDGVPRITVSGTISTRCRPRYIRKLMTHSYKSFYYTFVSELKKDGIGYHGFLRLGKVSKGAKALFTHRSRSLIKIIAKTLKKSNNLYARHIMLLLGAKLYGAPATLSKGRAAEKYILSHNGLSNLYAKIDNGCGLSRASRVNSIALSRLLDSANKKFGSRWRKALSIAGIDGTIKRRFRHSIARGRAWMKTGTLNDAKNIAGYVLSKSSHRLYSVVILYNGREKWKGSSLQNQIINWLAR